MSYSDHSIEYHRTWAAVLALFIVSLGSLLVFTGVVTHRSHLADLRYAHEEMAACIQSDRPASDCRLIVYGSR